MIPIQGLLARIRWDPAFGCGEFEIAYLDRIEKQLTRVPLRDVELLPGHFFLRLTGPDGELREVPLHRVREVYRDGRLIWCRDPRPGA